MKRKTLKEKIDKIVSDTYEIGYCHGRNPYVKKPEKVNEGWGKQTQKIMRLIKK